MQLPKIFRETFSETMLSHGFIYKNRVFIRVLGGDIVQAITIKTTYGHEYDFSLSIFPIWLYKRILLCSSHATNLSKHMLWREGFVLTFGGYENFPHTEELRSVIGRGCRHILVSYYADDPESVEQVVENFRYAAEKIEEIYLPILDKIQNFDAYMAWRAEKNTLLFTPGFHQEPIPVEALGYKAYVDGSPRWGIEYHYQQMRRYLLQKLPYSGYLLPDNDTSLVDRWVEAYANQELSIFEENKLNKWAYPKMKEHDEAWRSGVRACFWESAETGDFSWAAEYHDECLKEGTDLLKKSYPKLQGF